MAEKSWKIHTLYCRLVSYLDLKINSPMLISMNLYFSNFSLVGALGLTVAAEYSFLAKLGVEWKSLLINRPPLLPSPSPSGFSTSWTFSKTSSSVEISSSVSRECLLFNRSGLSYQVVLDKSLLRDFMELRRCKNLQKLKAGLKVNKLARATADKCIFCKIWKFWWKY